MASSASIKYLKTFKDITEKIQTNWINNFVKDIINILEPTDVLRGNYYFTAIDGEMKGKFVDYAINVSQLVPIPYNNLFCVYFEVYALDISDNNPASIQFRTEVKNYQDKYSYTYNILFPIIYAAPKGKPIASIIISPNGFNMTDIQENPPTHPDIPKDKLATPKPYGFITPEERQAYMRKTIQRLTGEIVKSGEFGQTIQQALSQDDPDIIPFEKIKEMNFCGYLFIQALYFMQDQLSRYLSFDNINDLQALSPVEGQTNCIEYFLSSFKKIYDVLKGREINNPEIIQTGKNKFYYDLSSINEAYPENIGVAIKNNNKLSEFPSYLIIRTNGVQQLSPLAFPMNEDEKFASYFFSYGIGETTEEDDKGITYNLIQHFEDDKTIIEITERNKGEKFSFIEKEKDEIENIQPEYFTNLKILLFKKYILTKDEARQYGFISQAT